MIIAQPSRPKIKRQRKESPHVVQTTTPSVTVTPVDTQVLYPSDQVLPAFYVDPSAPNDNGEGTEADPFQTLETARDAMRGSGTISRTYLRGGTYTRSSALLLNSNDNSTIWAAYPTETPIIDGNGNAIDLVNADICDNLRIEGITFTNSQTSTSVWAIDLNNCDNLIVLNNTFDDLHSGVRIRNGSTTGYVLENTFNNIQGDGLSSGGSSLRLEDNVDSVKIAGNNFTNSFNITQAPFGQFPFSQRNCTNITVEYNYANNLGGGWILFGNPPTASVPKTNLVIRYNKVTNTLNYASDAGAIYVNDRPNLDAGANILIHDNWVEEAGMDLTNRGTPSWANAIYLDDAQRDASVYNNVLIEFRTTAVHIHGGSNNSVYNNLALVRADDGHNFTTLGSNFTLFLENQGSSAFATGEPSMSSNSVEDNIMLSVDSSLTIASFSGGGQWLQENSQSADSYAEPGTIDGNVKHQDIPNWADDTTETNPDNNNPNWANGGSSRTDFSDKDFELSTLPSGFTHIAGVTDGGTFTWSSPSDNTNSGYDRSDYI